MMGHFSDHPRVFSWGEGFFDEGFQNKATFCLFGAKVLGVLLPEFLRGNRAESALLTPSKGGAKPSQAML